MAAGYLYVLVNSCMPGLVKVGKTTRNPADRVNELSRVTGVPTPFVLAFQSYFADCDAAEDFVHEDLQRRGLREAKNREFFRAAPGDVIRVILDTPGAMTNLAEGSYEEDDLVKSTSDRADELEEFSLPERNPWDDVLEEAESHYYGHEDFIEDYDEALKLYKQAARLGSPLAYEKIGRMYRHGEGVNEDEAKALSFFREGARKGNYYCYAEMASLFLLTNRENMAKCWNKFFELRSSGQLGGEVEEQGDSKFRSRCLRYVTDMISDRTTVLHVDILRPNAKDLYYEAVRRANDASLSYSFRENQRDVADWIDANLLRNCETLQHGTVAPGSQAASFFQPDRRAPNDPPAPVPKIEERSTPSARRRWFSWRS